MKNGLPQIDPKFLYGTAWKEDLTESCVFDALSAGYRAIDTANQRKHYYEEGVGAALIRAYSKLGIKREDLFLQTKFTHASGQDQRKPYDENASLKVQVQQSLASSLQHLHTDYLDSLVLHGPSTSVGLGDEDWEAWKEMESACKSGKARYIGISNVRLEQLSELYEGAAIKPAFVQNRCFAEKHWDKEIRDFCSSHRILYQGFSILTANWKFLAGNMSRPKERNIPHLLFSKDAIADESMALHPAVDAIVKETGKNIQQVVFRFVQQIGILPITGTRSVEHMKSNLEILDLVLNKSQLDALENIAFLR